METKIKSGTEVIEEFFAEILNIPGVDPKTAEALVSLYNKDKLTEKNLQNALDEIIQKELTKIEKGNE